jgi:lipoprotein-anchoring transpeptidase ErfK/SrfK
MRVDMQRSQNKYPQTPAPNHIRVSYYGTPRAASGRLWVPADGAPPPSRSYGGMIRAFLFITISGLLFFGALGGIAFLTYVLYTSDVIAPGVTMMGEDLGLLSEVEAEDALRAKWEQQIVRVIIGRESWPIKPSELGLILDTQASVAEAHAIGRSPQSLARLLGGAEVQPIWNFDEVTAAAGLQQFADRVAVEPVNATMEIIENEVFEIPPVDGQELDLEMTLAYLAADPGRVLREGSVPLATRPVTPAVVSMSELANEARARLAVSVDVRGYDPIFDQEQSWTVTPEQWHPWLSLVYLPESTDSAFEWVVDREAGAEFAGSFSETIGSERYLDPDTIVDALVEAVEFQEPSVSTRIYHHPRQHTVKAGETMYSIGLDYGFPFPYIQAANPEADVLDVGDVIAIPSYDEMLPLTPVENKRVIVSISEQRVWVYENRQLKWEWPASTGIDSSPTAPGIFQIQSHEPNAYAGNWDLWMPSFMGIYRPAPNIDFMNGFHGFPTRAGTTLLWTGDLGHKVTYGCILLSSENAALLYSWAEDGVVVEVRR